MAHELYGIEKGTGEVLEWANVTGIAYSDETLYEGETYRHDFSLSNATAGDGFLYSDDPATVKVSPDSVLKIAPRKKAVKRSIITITVTGGATFKVARDRLKGGCLFNIDPRSVSASGTTYYAKLRSGGDVVAWGAVTGIAYSNESVFDAETYSNEFDLTRALPTYGNLEDSAGNDAAPDSISKTAPGHVEKDRSIITVTITHGATPASMDLRVFREELAGFTLMNANPEA